ncbi:unnamed protein product [Didymodactylos carnosus]|uniref:Ubiquitin-like domain-containing protein n=1 Tax=Didymodactylos carnosus TaxID=1234261 RepID=A0A814QDZ2_9BILA|nr:unnamed protein product [Didymodactylos carnosus]CAF1118242.1 unnamed protein product [Didymodactylos carnosus]CAF3691943.1 unnamed protein product [Didymodactylos carnosus]CAF3881984.1 unnamed protein product [Didymodactylos carnosus]
MSKNNRQEQKTANQPSSYTQISPSDRSVGSESLTTLEKDYIPLSFTSTIGAGRGKSAHTQFMPVHSFQRASPTGTDDSLSSISFIPYSHTLHNNEIQNGRSRANGVGRGKSVQPRLIQTDYTQRSPLNIPANNELLISHAITNEARNNNTQHFSSVFSPTVGVGRGQRFLPQFDPTSNFEQSDLSLQSGSHLLGNYSPSITPSLAGHDNRSSLRNYSVLDTNQNYDGRVTASPSVVRSIAAVQGQQYEQHPSINPISVNQLQSIDRNHEQSLALIARVRDDMRAPTPKCRKNKVITDECLMKLWQRYDDGRIDIPAFLKAAEVLKAKSGNVLTVTPNTTIEELKRQVTKQKPELYPDRQSYRTEPTGKSVKDSQKLSELNVDKSKKIYFKDLGTQLGWSTVFLAEYAGPLLIYLLFYLRPSFIYGTIGSSRPAHTVVHLAAFCWTFHYAKRIFETLAVHRFSHNTMPLFNLFKNCGYYWGFTAWVAYFVNHPKYTPASFGNVQIYLSLAAFLINEMGNLSIHLALRDLRPQGSKERKIPYPTSNPFTKLFNFVSCPNYTYEMGSWMSFSIMTQTLTALIFTIAGAYQMTMWALGKHRLYKKEFPNYPKRRKAIIPFII